MKNIIVEKGYADHPHIAFIQLDRPKVMNALSTELMEEVVQALTDIDDDPMMKVTILTGNDRAFAAGADIAEMAEASPIDKILENRFRAWEQLSLIKKPIIAAVNGYALGGGCELAMSCDMLIAGDTAKFGQPEINIGTTPGAGGTQRLTKALGKAKAMYYAMTGEMFTAKEAYEWNLLTKVVPAEALLQETFEVAKKIADKAAIATRLIKESINKSFEMGLKDSMDFERRNFFLTFASSDQKEGMQAFLEKRKPKYTGR